MARLQGMGPEEPVHRVKMEDEDLERIKRADYKEQGIEFVGRI